MRYFTWKLELVSKILWVIAGFKAIYGIFQESYLIFNIWSFNGDNINLKLDTWKKKFENLFYNK